MKECESLCSKSNASSVRLHFMDKLVGRTLEEKMHNFCHVKCLKTLRIGNEKRNGRWGFIPVFGAQELFSSAFALISLILMVRGFNRQIKGKIHHSPMKTLYYIQYYICNAAFLSSFMFHFRETAATRFADYYTAFASILIGLVVALNRLVLLKKPKVHKSFQQMTLRIALSYFILHVIKMTFNEFDYFYNKVSCALMFFVSCLCNFATFLNYRNYSYYRNIPYFIICLLAAGGIEILDISPIFYLFDSHAMWHLLMMISTPFYVNYIAYDIDHQPQIKGTVTKKQRAKGKNKYH